MTGKKTRIKDPKSTNIKYELIWNRIKSITGTFLDKKPASDGKYLITKLNPYDGKINTDF